VTREERISLARRDVIALIEHEKQESVRKYDQMRKQVAAYFDALRHDLGAE
jgi:hypothetical protein